MTGSFPAGSVKETGIKTVYRPLSDL